MKKLGWMFLLMSMAWTITACGGNAGGNAGQSAEPAPAPAEGESGTGSAGATAAENVFKQNCSSCHGADLSGNIGPNLQKVGSKYSKDQILNIIANGRGQMPAGVIKGADADAVASWLAAKK